MANICDAIESETWAVETPLGPGEEVGFQETAEQSLILVDLGERMPGDIPVVMAFPWWVVMPKFGAMESGGQKGAMES